MEQFAIKAAKCVSIINQAKEKMEETREIVTEQPLPTKLDPNPVIQSWIRDMKNYFDKIKENYNWIWSALQDPDIRQMMSFTPGSLENAENQLAQIDEDIKAFRSKYSGWLKHFTGLITQKTQKDTKKKIHKARNDTNRRANILISQYHAAVRDSNEQIAAEVVEELKTIQEDLLNGHLITKYLEIIEAVQQPINYWNLHSDPGAGPSRSSTRIVSSAPSSSAIVDEPTGPIRECFITMTEAPHNALIKLHETCIDGRRIFCCISPDQFEPWIRMHDRNDFDAIDDKKGKKLGLKCREHGTPIDIAHVVNTLPKNPSRWKARFGDVPCPDGWKAIRLSLFDFISGQMIPVIRWANMQQHGMARLCPHCPYEINGYYHGTVMHLNGGRRTQPCLSCRRRQCLRCKHFYAFGPTDPIIRPQNDHTDRRCEYMEVLATGDVETADLQELLADAKQCPKCGIPTHKIKDCDHITCANPDCFSVINGERESTHWCYGCGDAWFRTRREIYAHMTECTHSSWTG